MGERSRLVPAARCRECGAVTWLVNLARGPRRVRAPDHDDGCNQPPGRMDLQAAVPLAKRLRLYGQKLENPMTDEDVEQWTLNNATD